jgi:predicted transcriptional regulator
MSVFLEKSGQILAKEDWFGKAFKREEIENFIDKYFTICWQHWFRLQIPFLVRHRYFYGDLETWNVWGSIGISQFTDYYKQVQNRVIEDPRSYADLYLHLLRHNPKNGINASSISEISNIPRATVIRKLKTLLKQKLIMKNKKLEYMLLPSPKNIKSFEQNYMHNQKYKANFVTTIFDLMKNSSFKVE